VLSALGRILVAPQTFDGALAEDALGLIIFTNTVLRGISLVGFGALVVYEMKHRYRAG
jgi:hypothetical protein